MITGNLKVLLAVENVYYKHASFLWTWNVSCIYLNVLIEVDWLGMVGCMRSNKYEERQMISISLDVGFSEEREWMEGEEDIGGL